MKVFDTITAIATPVGMGGIAIIRISGDDAEKIAGKITFLKSGRELSQLESHKLALAEVRRLSDATVLDEVLIAVMRAPHSYTGENVVEINCHGGYFVAKAVIEELFKAGARQAEAGEFTRRAFMNGKTDLLKAEATIDLIHSNSELGHSNAAKTLSGRLTEKVEEIRDMAVAFAANLSAVADYPDEIDPLSDTELSVAVDEISFKLDEMLGGFEKGKIMRDGILTVIVGRPNVGKSSILNALSRSERAIVTDIPGTTRDTVEEYVNVQGIALRLIDTAGIRESENVVEKIGIEKAKENITKAELCLFVLDASEAVSDDDIQIFNHTKDKNVIVLLNKTDKNTKIDKEQVAQSLGCSTEDIILTATPKAGKPMGIDDLENAITRKFMAGSINKDDVYISNERQKDSLIKAKAAAQRMKTGINSGMPQDMLYVDLEELIETLGEVTGTTVQDEIIEQVFSRFCVGK